MKFISRIKYHYGMKIKYPVRELILKITKPFLLKKYEIEELPFCLELQPIKDWKGELIFEYLIENNIDLEELEEI